MRVLRVLRALRLFSRLAQLFWLTVWRRGVSPAKSRV